MIASKAAARRLGGRYVQRGIKMKISAITAAVAAGVIFVSGAARAQSAASSSPEAALDEIIVSARKVSEDVQRVPISITALSGDQLKRQSVTELMDIQTTVPNLFLQPSGSDPQALYLSIRGQKQNDTPPTVDPSVGLYIDNLYYPRSVGLTGALLDVDRVEVLRGPQGTLFGRNTTGGAISFFSKDPTAQFSGNVSAEYGNFDAWTVSAVVNGPLVEGLTGRFVAEHDARGAYGHDAAGHDLGNKDDTYLRGKLKFEVGSWTAVLTGVYQNDVEGQNVWQLSGLAPAGGGLPEGGTATLEAAAELGLPFTPAGLAQAVNVLKSYLNLPRDRSGGTHPPTSQFMSEVIGLDVKDQISSELTLRSITGYEHLDRHVSSDIDATPFTVGEVVYQNRGGYFSQEFQILGGNEKFNWVAGAYYGDEHETYNESGNLLVDIAAISPYDSNGVPIENRSEAGFLQANWTFLPAWRLTVGGRYSHDERKENADNSIAGVCSVPAPGYPVTTSDPASKLCPQQFTASFSKPSWLISIDHQFDERLFGYAKVAYGYRSGGLNLRGNTFASSFASFKPETLTEYEMGVKWELFDRRLRINAAGFHDKYENAQRSIFIAGPGGTLIGLTENAASATIDGFELETNFRATGALTLGASVGYINPQYKSYIDATGDHSNQTFGVPKVTASASINYVLDTPIGAINNHLDYRYQSDFDLDPSTPTLIQMHQIGYGLLDARISLALQKFDVFVYGRNLTDQFYRASGSNTESLGVNANILGDPRTFGVGVTMNF
jgi:iron complex outermembrane receptor protein